MDEFDLGRSGARSAGSDPGRKAEVGDILLSARAVSREMIARARRQADEILREAEEKAAGIVRDAEEQAAEIVREAEERADDLAAAPPARVGRAASETDIEARVQENAVRRMEACLSELRRRQLETVDLINEQWQQFLCGMTLSSEEEAENAAAERKPQEITQQDIEAKVSAIARELMEIIGSSTGT